jgi:beta-lactamase class A
MRVWLSLPLLLAGAAYAQTSVTELLEQKTLAEIRRFADSFEGVLGVTAIDLTTGRSFAFHGDTLFPTASTIKIPILFRMYQAERAGQFRFSDAVTIAPKEAVGGSGRLQEALKKGPVILTIQELVRRMIVDSDNTATNRSIDIAGMAQVNRMLDEMGFPKTRLLRKMMDSAAAQRNDENVATPVEMARMAEIIYRGKAVDARASREMLEIMKEVKGGIREGLPLDIETASKTGELPGARCETGIVFLEHRPFVLSVMSAYIDDRRTPVPEVTRIVYRYFEKLAISNAYGRSIR